MPLMGIEDSRVGDTGRPRGEHVAAIAAWNDEMAFRQRERNLPRALDSLPLGMRVLVIDHASTDRTREIARERGAEVIERAWEELGLGSL